LIQLLHPSVHRKVSLNAKPAWSLSWGQSHARLWGIIGESYHVLPLEKREIQPPYFWTLPSISMTCMNELGFSTNLAGKFKLAGTLPGILPSQKKAANRSEQLGKLILQSI